MKTFTGKTHKTLAKSMAIFCAAVLLSSGFVFEAGEAYASTDVNSAEETNSDYEYGESQEEPTAMSPDYSLTEEENFISKQKKVLTSEDFKPKHLDESPYLEDEHAVLFPGVFDALGEEYMYTATYTPYRGAGDVNNDGNIDMTDLTMLSLILVDNVEFYDHRVCDVDSNGVVNICDLALLRQYISKNAYPDFYFTGACSEDEIVTEAKENDYGWRVQTWYIAGVYWALQDVSRYNDYADEVRIPCRTYNISKFGSAVYVAQIDEYKDAVLGRIRINSSRGWDFVQSCNDLDTIDRDEKWFNAKLFGKDVKVKIELFELQKYHDKEYAVSIYNNKDEFIGYLFACSATTDTGFFMVTGKLREDCSYAYLGKNDNECMIDLRMIQNYVDNYIIDNELF